MDYKILISTITTFLFISFWILIYFKGAKTTLTKTFSYLAFSMILWSLGITQFYFEKDPQTALFWAKELYIGGSLITACVLLLSFVYPAGFFTIPKFKRFLIFVPNILLTLIFFFTPWGIISVVYIDGVKGFVFGPLKILFDIQFFTIFSYGFLRFTKIYRHFFSGILRSRLKFIIFGTLTALILAGTTNVVMPMIGQYQYIWVGPTLAITWLVAMGYAILRYQLIDIHIIIKRSLVYTVLITCMTTLYFITILITERIFMGIIGYKSLIASIITAAIIALVFSPLKNAIQNFIDKYFFRGSFFQIAEQNELLRKEVAQAEKLKAIATLASGMAHEIKNPLTAIKTFSDHLPNKKTDHNFLNNFSKIVSREVDRIDGLVNQLLDFARPSTPDLKETNIHDLLDETHALTNQLFENNHIKVIKKYTNHFHLLFIDANQIHQALFNLYLNAIDAMPEGGEFKIVTVVNSREKFEIILTDNGYGISENDIDKIFDPFFSRKDEGTGLGLSITQGIVKEHNGNIDVKSELGIGTRFTIEIPLQHQPIRKTIPRQQILPTLKQ